MANLAASVSAWSEYLYAVLCGLLVAHAVYRVVRAFARGPRFARRGGVFSALAALALAALVAVLFYRAHGPGTPPRRGDPGQSGINQLIDRAAPEPSAAQLRAHEKTHIPPELERARSSDFSLERAAADDYIDKATKRNQREEL